MQQPEVALKRVYGKACKAMLDMYLGIEGEASYIAIFSPARSRPTLGETPAQDTIDGMKQAIVNLANSQNSLVLEGGKQEILKEIMNFALDKMLTKRVSQNLISPFLLL